MPRIVPRGTIYFEKCYQYVPNPEVYPLIRLLSVRFINSAANFAITIVLLKYTPTSKLGHFQRTFVEFSNCRGFFTILRIILSSLFFSSWLEFNPAKDEDWRERGWNSTVPCDIKSQLALLPVRIFFRLGNEFDIKTPSKRSQPDTKAALFV